MEYLNPSPAAALPQAMWLVYSAAMERPGSGAETLLDLVVPTAMRPQTPSDGSHVKRALSALVKLGLITEADGIVTAEKVSGPQEFLRQLRHRIVQPPEKFGPDFEGADDIRRGSGLADAAVPGSRARLRRGRRAEGERGGGEEGLRQPRPVEHLPDVVRRSRIRPERAGRHGEGQGRVQDRPEPESRRHRRDLASLRGAVAAGGAVADRPVGRFPARRTSGPAGSPERDLRRSWRTTTTRSGSSGMP